MLRRSTLQLLRFHFSLFLLPVFLFALSQLEQIHLQKALLCFGILHLLVYPASNGYNSYMDRDESPIGGLAHPMQPTRQLFHVTVLMDVAAVLLSIFVSPVFALGILFYILASRAYSYRRIRLKKLPVTGFLTVFVFQGGVIFFITYYACSATPLQLRDVPLLPCLISSLLIGASYPLTQIYQHQADLQDGVTTISYLLGKKGTFLFSAVLFMGAAAFLFIWFNRLSQPEYFTLFLFITLPMVLFFCYWMISVWKNEKAANFKNSLRMNVLSTLCTLAFFITLIYLMHFE